MNDPLKIVRREIFYNNFIYSEIVKRHIEEYDPESCDFLEGIRSLLKRKYVNYENTFLVVVGEALDAFRIKKAGKDPQYSDKVEAMKEQCEELFEFDKLRDIYDSLYNISNKYNIPATSILFPVDMQDVIENYSPSFEPPVSTLFKTDYIDTFIIIKDDDAKLKVKPNMMSFNEEDVNKLKIQFIIHRILKEENISQEDKDFLNRHFSQNANFKVRLDSFIKYIIGMHCWDMERRYGNDRKSYELYQEFQEKNKKCKGSRCFKEMSCKDVEQSQQDIANFYCSRQDTCKKYVREAKRLVSICIKDCQLYKSKKTESSIKPVYDKYYERRKVKFFRGEK